MIREEHMDLFGNVSAGTYTRDKAVTSSAVASNILEMGDKEPVALWNCMVEITEDFVADTTSAGTKVTFKVECAKALSSGALSDDVDVYTQEVLTANLKVGKVFSIVIPRGYKYVKVTATPTNVFTAGKVAGNVYPDFN